MISTRIKPMQAMQAASLPAGNWIYEPKLDGYRCLSFKTGQDVELISKSGKNLTAAFNDVAETLKEIKADFVLDGEIVPESLNFDHLQGRFWSGPLRKNPPVVYFAYDILHLNGQDLVSHPYHRRRQALESLAMVFPPGVLLNINSSKKETALSWLGLPGLDGIVAKNPEGRYAPGKRYWIKYKEVRTADCVIAGVAANKEGNVTQLFLGLYEGGKIHYVGRSKISDELGAAITPLLKPLMGKGGFTGKAPDRYIPLEPKIVVEVSHQHAAGRRFRIAPVFKRFRPDYDPAECTFEQLTPLK